MTEETFNIIQNQNIINIESPSLRKYHPYYLTDPKEGLKEIYPTLPIDTSKLIQLTHLVINDLFKTSTTNP